MCHVSEFENAGHVTMGEPGLEANACVMPSLGTVVTLSNTGILSVLQVPGHMLPTLHRGLDHQQSQMISSVTLVWPFGLSAAGLSSFPHLITSFLSCRECILFIHVYLVVSREANLYFTATPI